jgi:polysaccharide pyruvyl transferase WcaK-like protein
MFYRLLIAAALRKQIIAVSVGVQRPITHVGRAILSHVLRRTHYLICRDRVSAEIGADLLGCRRRVFSCIDAVLWHLRLSAFCSREPMRDVAGAPLRVAVAVKSLPWKHPFVRKWGEGAIVEVFAEGLVRLASTRDISVRILAFGESDRPVAQVLSDRLANAGLASNIELSCDTTILRQVMSEQELVLGMPLHACVFAFGLGIPAVGIAYDSKVSKLFRQFALSEFCIEPPDFSSASVLRCCDRAIESGERTRTVLRDRGAEECESLHRVMGECLSSARAHTQLSTS